MYENLEKNWFSHSGDIGDIIYALPAIRAKGGGSLRLFDVPGKTAHGMTEQKVNNLKPLLEAQEYIHQVIWSPGGPDHSLNGFRHHGGHGNLADMHLATQGLSWEERVAQWIHVEPKEVAKVIFHRTPRYQNRNFYWIDAAERYSHMGVFIGNKREHTEFMNMYGSIDRYDWKDFLECAQIIAGSKLFIGNQSSPLAIAHGLKHPTVMEIHPGGPPQQHCVFQRINCIIGWDRKIEWPEIK